MILLLSFIELIYKWKIPTNPPKNPQSSNYQREKFSKLYVMILLLSFMKLI